ncbi:MAG: type I-E CRISPR-associated protein Cse1/CasA [Hyphomonas sp.]
MPELLNVFEHQRFRLRTPAGERISKSFREIVTEPDAAYALDYAQAFYDVAALNLLSYLAQVAFEPQTTTELAARIAAPMSEAEFEERVAPLRARFALTGDGPRFMQAPGKTWASRSELIGRAILTTHEAPNKTQDDKRFLNRLDLDWAVPVEQAAVFLFARNTFYPGMLGGHKKGTNGSNPVRVLVTDPAEGDAVTLRRTIWLNVLAHDRQREYSGAYGERDSNAYDGLFWIDPPSSDVPVGGITLRAALGWMSDYYWLPFEETSGLVCPVTGMMTDGLAARTMKRSSTRRGFGDETDNNFRHPNVPTETLYDAKTREVLGERPFTVQRTAGLAKAVGAAFFGGRTGGRKSRYTLAPAVGQLDADPIQQLGLSVRLRVFGFHMLSAQKNVHGGIEQSTFAFRPPVPDTPDGLMVLDQGAAIMGRATDFAAEAARALGKAVQQTTGAGVRAKETEDGQIQIQKLESIPSVEDPYGRDVLAAFWRDAETRLADLAGRVAEAGANGPAGLAAHEIALRAEWEAETFRAVYRLFEPVFDHYSTLPRTMPYAHAARRLLAGTLRKLRSTAPEGATPEPAQPEPA